ncbi:hypothetical protein IV203_031029 [Nitzschia inconspicua]|uniref:Uncharacterized protein n=1 Tax=Nitzschia inconspicua TaxID=303405 RepID=A0A9K3LWC1_9STRA|nr:hypothetical protein IV203_031029 [Nitzschia inconspicua]
MPLKNESKQSEKRDSEMALLNAREWRIGHEKKQISHVSILLGYGPQDEPFVPRFQLGRCFYAYGASFIGIIVWVVEKSSSPSSALKKLYKAYYTTTHTVVGK